MITSVSALNNLKGHWQLQGFIKFYCMGKALVCVLYQSALGVKIQVVGKVLVSVLHQYVSGVKISVCHNSKFKEYQLEAM